MEEIHVRCISDDCRMITNNVKYLVYNGYIRNNNPGDYLLELYYKGDVISMTFMTLIVLFIIGLLMLLIGVTTKKGWLKLLSIIPLSLSLWNFAILFSMGS